MAEEDGMVALAATVSTMRMLADGSLSMAVIIEPKDRVQAMALFGQPGQPLAIAALKEGYAAAGFKPATGGATRDQRGPLCREAIDLCNNPKFLDFIAVEHFSKTPDAAKGYILGCCGINSRKELDTNAEAARTFATRVRRMFQQWVREQQE